MSRRLGVYAVLVLAAFVSGMVAYATLYRYITTNATVTFASEGVEVRNARVVEKSQGVQASITVKKSSWNRELVVELRADKLAAGDRVVYEFEVHNIGTKKVELSVDQLKSSINGPFGCYANVEVDYKGIIGWIKVNPWDRFTLNPGDSINFRVIIRAPSDLSDDCAGAKATANDIFKLHVTLQQ